MHTEIAVKVNATVDTEIAPLVLALNRFPELVTVDSCQGGGGKPAYVYFKYGETPQDLAVFCADLAYRLTSFIVGANEYSLRVEWAYDFSTNMAVIETSPDHVNALSQAVASVANGFRRSQ